MFQLLSLAVVVGLLCYVQGQKLPNLLELVESTDNLSTLSTAISLTSLGPVLEDGDDLTVFAPMNKAFEKLDAHTLELLLSKPYVKHLENLLLYHVIVGAVVYSTDLKQGDQVVTMANNEKLTVTKDKKGVMISYPCDDDAVVKVVTADVEASNGVAHIIDGVLLPKFVCTPFYTLAEEGIEGYSIVFDLILYAFPDGLPIKEPFTLLAPNDEAFNALGQKTLDSLTDPANLDTLISILANHVIVGVTPSSALEDGMVVTTLGGLKLKVMIKGDKVMFHDATVIKPDILAIDAIVHGIDKVLLEESPKNCSSTTCPAKSKCVETDKGSECVCIPGFRKNPKTGKCEDAVCFKIKCGKNERCTQTKTGKAVCVCRHGYVKKNGVCVKK